MHNNLNWKQTLSRINKHARQKYFTHSKATKLMKKNFLISLRAIKLDVKVMNVHACTFLQMMSGIVYYKMSSKKGHQFAANICTILENVTIVYSQCIVNVVSLQPNYQF